MSNDYDLGKVRIPVLKKVDFSKGIRIIICFLKGDWFFKNRK